uniref:YTH domain-containing protein n=1 Tax=Salmonella sp. s58953 TaxID=3159711 RepID=UPI00397FC81A
VGVAEMVGPVDFHKNFEYWQQDKWNGFFPVKWHIVKDLSNSLLKHITLEYNENKPVTNSRDSQEVKLEQGLQMLKIFKDHSSKTCILDDFPFYEGRQKTIQEKKAKQQQFPKQIWEGKPVTDEKSKEVMNGELKPQPLKSASANLVNETSTTPIPANGDATKISENGSVAMIGALKAGLKSAAVSEVKNVVNGIA